LAKPNLGRGAVLRPLGAEDRARAWDPDDAIAAMEAAHEVLVYQDLAIRQHTAFTALVRTDT